MKLLSVIFLILICLSCTQSKKKNISLSGKVYSFAPELDTTNCTVSGQCDCCSYQLYFYSEKGFVMIDFCEANQTVLSGVYSATVDSVTLKFANLVVDKIYNWESELTNDTNAVVAYDIATRKTDGGIGRFSTFYCNRSLCLKAADQELYYGVPDKSTSASQLQNQLEEEGIWHKLGLD